MTTSSDRGFYPIKVNLRRRVEGSSSSASIFTTVSRPLQAGAPADHGLHQTIMPGGVARLQTMSTSGPALLASKLCAPWSWWREPTEIDHIHKFCRRARVKPSIGIRARLSARARQVGSSRAATVKFCLSSAEMLSGVQAARLGISRLKLRHFPSSRRSPTPLDPNALREAGRFVRRWSRSAATLVPLRRAASADYDGARRPLRLVDNYRAGTPTTWCRIQPVCQDPSSAPGHRLGVGPRGVGLHRC